MDKVKILFASVYLYVKQQLGDNLLKIDAVIQHARGEGKTLAMDSNRNPPYGTTNRKTQEAKFSKNSLPAINYTH